MHKTALAPGQRLRWRNVTSARPLPGVVQRVTRLSKLPKSHVNSYRRQTVYRSKVDPGVSELPWGNELSPGSCEQALRRHLVFVGV